MTTPPEPTDVLPPADPPLAPTELAAGGPEMTVVDHLEEMRWRILKSLAAIAIAALAVFYFNKPIIVFLEAPLHMSVGPFAGAPPSVELIYTGPGEYFMSAVKVSLLGGLYLALPVVLYQLIAFVGPGLLPTERRWAVPTVLGAFVFFTIGMVFAYYLMLPAGLQFLIGFAPPEVKALLQIGKYLSFAAGLVFATGLAFELPLFLLMASALGIVTSYSLAKHRRSAFFVSFVIAAILTPSIDVFSQVMMAGALYALFELSIFLIRLTGK
jgi:sec-independent protein translocase protein TatC